MFKINEHLYLGKVSDIESLMGSPYNLMIISRLEELELPSEDQIKLNELIQLSGKTSQRQIKLFEVENEEIPHYRISEFETILNELNVMVQQGETVIISRNGQSRGPSIALLWMAFRLRSISKSSYAAARMDFSRLYPQYIPWPGMVIFLNQEWDALVGSLSKIKLNL